MDVEVAVRTIETARLTLQELCSNSVCHFESAEVELARLANCSTDPLLLGSSRGLLKQLGRDLQAVNEYCAAVAAIAGPTQAAHSNQGPRLAAPDYDGPASGGIHNDHQGGYAAPQDHDNDWGGDAAVWRPPTRDGPVRVPGARAVAPIRSRSSADERQAGPVWARNANSNGQQAGVLPARDSAPAVGGRAISAQRQQPARANAGNRGGGAAAGAGARQEPDRPWRANMAPKGGQAPGASAEGKKRVVITGPDAELAQQLERDMLDGSPGIKWEDIAGLSEAKRVLQEAAVLPLLMPEYFQGVRRPVRGCMLFGPPGTGKTMLAKAVATETGSTFFNVGSASLGSKYRGESERLVRCLFDLARANAPSIIFIDEVDSLCSQRGSQNEHEASRRTKTELLTQIDGIHVSVANNSSKEDGELPGRVLVLAATNFPWDIDEAMRRRLEKRIYIALPGADERLELLKINLRGVVLADDLDIGSIAKMLDGYSGDDITNIVRDACMNGLRRHLEGRTPTEIKQLREQGKDLANEPVTHRDFEQACKRINPSVNPADLKRHLDWHAEFGSC